MKLPIDEEISVIREITESLAAEVGQADAESIVSTYGYFRAKCQIYFRKGAADYRRDDFFHVPRAEWSDAEIERMEHGFRQAIVWKGLSAERPFEGLELPDLYRMIEVVHFQLEHLSAQHRDGNSTLVTLDVIHRMDGRKLKLRYKLPAQGAAGIPNSGSARRGWLSALLGGRSRVPPQPPVLPEDYGYSPEHPILCDDPLGELQFLHQLRCPNGHPFGYHRIGSMGGICPEPNSHIGGFTHEESQPTCIVDKYELRCHEGEHTCHLYFDMYHHVSHPQPVPKGLSREIEETE